MEVNDNLPGLIFSDVMLFTTFDNAMACSEGEARRLPQLYAICRSITLNFAQSLGVFSVVSKYLLATLLLVVLHSYKVYFCNSGFIIINDCSIEEKDAHCM